jgi:hypothetical protein
VSRFVLDASVVLTWCFPDENIGLAQQVADRFKQGDAGPSFWPHEVPTFARRGKTQAHF